MPHHGDRVFVRPSRPTEQVQRGEGLYGQFIAPEGQEVVCDGFISARLTDGSLIVCDPPAEVK